MNNSENPQSKRLHENHCTGGDNDNEKHIWLMIALKDILDYSILNGLNPIIPFVDAACVAVERKLLFPQPIKRISQKQLAAADDRSVVNLQRALDTRPVRPKARSARRQKKPPTSDNAPTTKMASCMDVMSCHDKST